ncbi:MAG: aminotransferase class V-fold PLP-dependent enzyme [Gammaproteobacteria bacterium]|jgi:cysteine desulfurase/selenocysteine lyase|nr:aminotransferase class V-fold PLP-dependent enzyme [Gammaproteobacteria bacterium]MBQ0773670.1 aminotransferase class V-fold PLP-dependent enzyme [Gammaproteobacteria bacterium]
MEDWSTEFPQADDLLYLNHAAVAPWPKRTHDAVCRFAAENLHQGARWYPRWAALEQTLREQMRELINAPSVGDISLLKNTSEGLSLIAGGLDWQPGDVVLISDQEFPSNRIPWQALSHLGVHVKEVDISGENPEDAIIAAMTGDVRLLAISSVQYGTGIMLDLTKLGQACQQRNILFCVDAIQSLGVVAMDVRAISADFVIADGHKWMLGPEGLALFYCRAERRAELALQQFGWHMIANAGDYSQRDWQPAEDGKRFECGSPNMLCAHALSASLSLILEVGIEKITQDVNKRIDYLADNLTQRGLTLTTPLRADMRAGIITFVPESMEIQTCYRALMSAGVICAPRGGGIRFSPHFYTPFNVLDRALQVLDGILAEAR